jgi:hypothetical protein
MENFEVSKICVAFGKELWKLNSTRIFVAGKTGLVPENYVEELPLET